MTNRICCSFDFDDTLAQCYFGGYNDYFVAIPEFVQLLKEYHALGCDCIILTARTNTDLDRREIDQFLKRHQIDHCVSKIVFTDHQLKGPFAIEHNVKLHYDDDLDHLKSVREHGVQGISSKL